MAAKHRAPEWLKPTWLCRAACQSGPNALAPGLPPSSFGWQRCQVGTWRLRGPQRNNIANSSRGHFRRPSCSPLRTPIAMTGRPLAKGSRRRSDSFSSNSSLAFTKPLPKSDMSCHSPMRREHGAMLCRLLTNRLDVCPSSLLWRLPGECCSILRAPAAPRNDAPVGAVLPDVVLPAGRLDLPLLQ